MNRRQFLNYMLEASATGSLLWLGPAAWAARAESQSGPRRPLVVIFLRGAVDGLNVLPPHGESSYYEARPTIAVAQSRVLDLDGRFGLHPALGPLMPLWRERSLAFVCACGSPDPSRSHFEAQDYMETGTPGVHTTADGWMNRLLAVHAGPHPSTEALNLGPTMPRILSGPMPIANLPMGPAASKPIALDRPEIEAAFARMYQNNDSLSLAFREGYQARQRLMGEIKADMTVADAGAPYPNQAFLESANQLGRLIDRDASVRMAFLALGGWDTHVGEGSAEGQLANHLRPLGEGIASLVTGLGKSYAGSVIVVISEFGRTVRENGNGGTDHGHGNVMWVLGGPVRGGRIYGAWPGLEQAELYQGRDLAITTDFRTVLSTVLIEHLGLDRAQVGRVFPGFVPSSAQTRTVAGLLAA